MNLRLLQIADSALPIGGYTHSWGLEAAIGRGLVRDPETLENWTRRWLAGSLAPLEGTLVAAACRAGRAGDAGRLRLLNETALASTSPPSIRKAGLEMGEQLIALGLTWCWSEAKLRALLGADPDPAGWHHATAFGLLAAVGGAEPVEATTAFLHQAALGMIGAGVRAIPVGHTHGQQLLAYLQDDVAALASDCAEREFETAGGGCPFHEILCDEQTRLYARMYRS